MKRNKRIAALIATGMVALSLAGCQPTPERQAVVNKQGGALEQKIAAPQSDETASQQGETLYEKLGAPQHLSEEWQGGTLSIRADAEVVLPDAAQVSVVRAARRAFTQEEVDRVGQALFGKEAVYIENILLTKEQIESFLVEERRFLAESEAAGDTQFVEKAKESIRIYEELYPDTPSASDIQETDLTLREITSGSNINEKTQGVDVTCALGEEQFHFSVYNDLEMPYISMSAFNGMGFGSVPIDAPYGLDITKEQAEEKARSIVSAIGIDGDYAFAHAGIATEAGAEALSQRRWGWACVFTRMINDCPATYTVDDVGSNMDSELKAPVSYETVVVVVDDMGAIGFGWSNPLEITAVENENVALLPFEEIKQRAYAQLEAKYADIRTMANPDLLGVNVTGIRFGMARVDRPDSGDYYYLPVWDFYNEGAFPENPDNEPIETIDEQGDVIGGVYSGYALETYNAVTINAIDGSVIDRLIGH